jgi:ankyrin repeat protein
MKSRVGFAAGAAAGLLLAVSPALAATPAPAEKGELAEAIAKQKTSKIEKLLSKPGLLTETPYDSRTALFYAAAQGDDALVAKLLALGAKADARDGDRATPLMAALRNPSTKWSTVKALLDGGADVNAADKDGGTALIRAVLRAPGMIDTDAQVATIEGLLAAGADPARVDASGAMAMHHAAAVGEPRKVLELLMAKAPDRNAVTLSGANVLMMAAQNKQRANVDFLLNRGFRPVRIRAVGERPTMAQDVSIRANALANDWSAQYLARKEQGGEARAAYTAAVADYAAAADEAKRLAALYEQEIVKDKQGRAEHRAVAGLMSVLSLGAALASGGGYYSMYTPVLSTKLEQDEHALATLNAEAAESTARAAAIRTALAKSSESKP